MRKKKFKLFRIKLEKEHYPLKIFNDFELLEQKKHFDEIKKDFDNLDLLDQAIKDQIYQYFSFTRFLTFEAEASKLNSIDTEIYREVIPFISKLYSKKLTIDEQLDILFYLYTTAACYLAKYCEDQSPVEMCSLGINYASRGICSFFRGFVGESYNKER